MVCFEKEGGSRVRRVACANLLRVVQPLPVTIAEG